MKIYLSVHLAHSKVSSYHLNGVCVGSHLKGPRAPLILEWMDILSASESIQKKIPVENIAERPGSLAGMSASGQALHLCRAVG
jgi:hypothetical protein